VTGKGVGKGEKLPLPNLQQRVAAQPSHCAQQRTTALLHAALCALRTATGRDKLGGSGDGEEELGCGKGAGQRPNQFGCAAAAVVQTTAYGWGGKDKKK
jgi:hypothetical protein